MLPRSNPFNKKTMGNLPGEAITLQVAQGIEKTLNDQEHDLSEVAKAMKELAGEADSLRDTIHETSAKSQAQA